MQATETEPEKIISQSAPTAQTERLVILDSLRGIAILGILIMNIPGFGIPVFMIEDISIRQEYSGINFYVWAAVNGVFEGTMRSIFQCCLGRVCCCLLADSKKTSGNITCRIFFSQATLVIGVRFV